MQLYPVNPARFPFPVSSSTVRTNPPPHTSLTQKTHLSVKCLTWKRLSPPQPKTPLIAVPEGNVCPERTLLSSLPLVKGQFTFNFYPPHLTRRFSPLY